MSTEKLFWSQYLGPEHPVPFSDQLKQLVELHRLAELAMKDLIVRLWPADPIPSSYFGLVQRLVSACPRLEAVKRTTRKRAIDGMATNGAPDMWCAIAM